MEFVKSHFEKENLWPVKHFFEHICHHFWVAATANQLGATVNPSKSDDKYAQKSVQLVRGSSFWSDFLQNSYFSTKIEIIYRRNTIHENKNKVSELFSTHCTVEKYYDS